MAEDKIENILKNSSIEMQIKLIRLKSTREEQRLKRAKKNNLNCQKCGHKFNKLSQLIIHLRQHTAKTLYSSNYQKCAHKFKRLNQE